MSSEKVCVIWSYVLLATRSDFIQTLAIGEMFITEDCLKEGEKLWFYEIRESLREGGGWLLSQYPRAGGLCGFGCFPKYKIVRIS